PDLIGLAALILVCALLYSMVGHGGASAYLAALSLYGIAPAVMKPTALVLNIVVATVTTIQFARAGLFDWQTFWPFALGSVPLAVFGGSITLPGVVYQRIVAAVLVFAAFRLFLSAGSAERRPLRRVPRPAAVLSG